MLKWHHVRSHRMEEYLLLHEGGKARCSVMFPIFMFKFTLLRLFCVLPKLEVAFRGRDPATGQIKICDLHGHYCFGDVPTSASAKHTCARN